MCGSMPAQIVRSQFDPNLTTGFPHYSSGRFVTYPENPLIGIGAGLFHIFLQSISHLPGNENEFHLLSTLGFPDGQFPSIDVMGCQVQKLPDPHPTPCRDLQKKLVPGLCGLENDLIDGVLFNGAPASKAGVSKKFL